MVKAIINALDSLTAEKDRRLYDPFRRARDYVDYSELAWIISGPKVLDLRISSGAVNGWAPLPQCGKLATARNEAHVSARCSEPPTCVRADASGTHSQLSRRHPLWSCCEVLEFNLHTFGAVDEDLPQLRAGYVPMFVAVARGLDPFQGRGKVVESERYVVVDALRKVRFALNDVKVNDGLVVDVEPVSRV